MSDARKQVQEKKEQFSQDIMDLYRNFENEAGAQEARNVIMTAVMGLLSADFAREYNLMPDKKESIERLKVILMAYFEGHVNGCLDALGDVMGEGFHDGAMKNLLGEIKELVEKGEIKGPRDIKKYVRKKLEEKLKEMQKEDK